MKRFIRTLTVITALIIISGCQEQLFTEYDGQSFISRNMTSPDVWQLMPDYDFTSEGTSVTDYMDYTYDISETGPNGGRVYRLEIKNLMDNGDFETGAVNQWDPWFFYDSTNITFRTPTYINGETRIELIDSSHATLSSYAIDSNSLYMNLPNDYLAYFTFSTAFTNPLTYVATGKYMFSYDYRNDTSLTIFYIKDFDYTAPNYENNSTFKAYGGEEGTSFPPFIPADITTTPPNQITASSVPASMVNDSLVFATTSQVASIDNFKVVRAPEGDFDLRLRLKLDIDHRTDLNLISGYYRFSVWVKAATLITGDNSYAADRVELGISGSDEENELIVPDERVFYRTQQLANQNEGSYSGDWSSGWVQLVFESNQTIQIPNYSDSPVIELTISPSNPGNSGAGWNRLNPGTILISEPKLEYSSTGW